MKSVLFLLFLMLCVLLAAVYGLNKEMNKGYWCADEAYGYVWCRE
jgi:hypothetical protein